MSPLVNITDSIGPGFAWRSASLSLEQWWEILGRDSSIARWWPKVKRNPISGCWLLQMAPASRAGHVLIRFHGQRIYAHRLIYFFVNGAIPLGKVVRHSCDDPACVRPDHLSVGSQRDNVHDSVKRGRRCAFGRQRLAVG